MNSSSPPARPREMPPVGRGYVPGFGQTVMSVSTEVDMVVRAGRRWLGGEACGLAGSDRSDRGANPPRNLERIRAVDADGAGWGKRTPVDPSDPPQDRAFAGKPLIRPSRGPALFSTRKLGYRFRVRECSPGVSVWTIEAT